jgi:glycosyltransferase involved in cell wall biosynthesis
MKVLHLCPLWHPIAHDAPGGIETLLAQLVAVMPALGYQTTILASGDSRTDAELVAAVPRNVVAGMADGTVAEYAYYEQHQLRLALELAPEFDIVHSHVGSGAWLLSALPELRGRVLHTVHSPVNGDMQWFVRHHPDEWFSTVSEHQARKLREAGAARCRAVHNGIDVGRFTFRPQPDGGLLYIGRMEAVKGPDAAVRVARELGLPLTLAGPIVERTFFEREVVPLLDDRIRYVGVVDHYRKNELFGAAACALLPFRGEEPFGLVAVEAMACGTPVVSFANGALPEIVEPGVTGYLAREEAELAPLVEQAAALDRAAVRARGAARFDIASAAGKYHALYREMARGAMAGDTGRYEPQTAGRSG